MAGRTKWTSAVAGATALVLASCASWQPAAESRHWTLYAPKGESVDASAYRTILDPAVSAVEGEFGPFEKSVRVFAWNGSGEIAHASSARSAEDGDAPLRGEDGSERARLRGFHARSDGWFGPPSGVYIGSDEAGTAVHELVHARVAEIDAKLPLWFEEGVACLMGDGFLAGDRWIVDGLWCWPLRELAVRPIGDDELARLIAYRSDEAVSSADNVLVHFVGWAIVFDMYREDGAVEWEEWRARARAGVTFEEARERLDRTTGEGTVEAWLERLSDERREVRIATAKGLWKLRSATVVNRLLDVLDEEEDPEVQVALCINILAGAGDTVLSNRLTRRMWRRVWPTLRRVELADPVAQAAVEDLTRSFRYRSRERSEKSLEVLAKYWTE